MKQGVYGGCLLCPLYPLLPQLIALERKAAIFESHANNPKLKTGETVSRFELNRPVKQPSRGESLLENQKINQAGFILDLRTEISELQPRINLLFNRLCKVKCRLTRKPETWKPGNTENGKCRNPDHPEISKSEINQKPSNNQRQLHSFRASFHKYQLAMTQQPPIIWNDIPLTVRNSLTTSNFQKKLRLHSLST